MRLLLIVFLWVELIVISSTGACAQSTPYKVALPGAWVVEHEVPIKGVNDTACLRWGEEILLLDRQYDLAGEQLYWRSARRLISTEGVQNGSRIEASFDPTFQKLTIHHLRLIRNGVVIDQLNKATLRVLHREEDLNSHLYDGSLTVVGEMHDVRVGDVVDYALSIRGWNPVDQGHFHKYLAMGYSVPVARSHTRIIVPPGREPKVGYHDFDQPPVERATSRGREWTWDIGPLDCIHLDDNVPSWYNGYPAIDITEFASVEELRTWALEQYEFKQQPSSSLEERIAGIKAIPDLMDRVDSAVRMVQREIRYLGLEEGISAYRPHAPTRVFEQRYGDCKDKSLLLTTILRGAGVDAFPALVNTRNGRALDSWSPRPSLFDHCITMILLEGDTLWADATSGHNGGRGLARYTPNYGKALVVGRGFDGYTTMSVRDTGSVEVTERFILGSIGGPGELDVESVYHGRRADDMRASLASVSMSDLVKGYRDFYAGILGPCEETEPLRIEDDTDANVIHTYEHYKLDQPWDTIDDGRTFSFNISAYHIQNHQYKPGRTIRTSPFFLGEPMDIRHRIIVELPESWTVTPEEVDHGGYGITYKKVVTYDTNRVVTLDYRYTSNLQEIPALDAMGLQDLQETINDNLYFVFTRPIDGSAASVPSFGWSKWLFILFCVGISVFGAIRLYRYDPQAHPDSVGLSSRPIGSFLILPAIGLCFTPIRALYDMFSDAAAFFHATDYVALAQPKNPLFADLAIHFSQFMGFAQTAFAVLLIVLYFERRTSTPFLMKVLYAVSAGWLIVDSLLYEALGFAEVLAEPYPYRDLSRAIFAACIWIPVFHFSGRVHTTFTKRLKNVYPVQEPLLFVTDTSEDPPASKDPKTD